jgi:hypothetical protein
MRSTSKAVAWAAATTLSAGAASASEILVTSNIAVSTTWTANNTYNLQQQIYVLPGATLTIEPGTVIASDTGLGGSLAVCKGAQIFVLGTASNPVIMTSKADVLTWAGSNPATGTWREAANEWGNLTVMGDAYISENATPGNTAIPSASNVAAMEGLVAGFPGDTKVLYGGGDDDDDSGTIRYLSVRYGGKVIGLNNELNGYSFGGLGRGTDIHHLEVMNNVDDGIEVWGGTANFKYFSIWNVGDDSFDVDQGWRGKAQFGLIVQGHSLDAPQGSGVGDNGFEVDGAEDSNWQPVTTATIYNCTVIGQPVDGDHGTAWRDNARVQYRNCIFMDLGERLVQFDNVDGDGGSGYGFNGTLSWASTWTTNSNVYSGVNAPPNPAAFYTAQTSGKLAEIKDSVFFRNLFGTAYTEATSRGVFDAGNNNVLIPGFDPNDAPIVAITRGPAVIKGGKTMLPVTSLDPRPANEALVSVAAAPNDGFFTPAQYRGAFAPGQSWLGTWTASTAFGFTQPDAPAGVNYCTAGTTTNGCNATIVGLGTPSATATAGFTLQVSSVEGAKQGIIFYGISGQAALQWGTGSSFLCVKSPTQRMGTQNSGGTAGLCDGALSIDWNAYTYSNPGVLGTPFSAGAVVQAQGWFRDPPASKTTSLSNGFEFTVQP